MHFDSLQYMSNVHINTISELFRQVEKKSNSLISNCTAAMILSSFCIILTKYKKFELILTGRAKAYSSSCPQAVTHRSTNRARRRVTSFQLKRVTNYATPPTPVPWRHLVNDIALCRSAKSQKNP